MGEITGSAPPSPRERLRHVYWLGGGSGAGKSVIARRLAAQHGLRRYLTDDVMADHARRATPPAARSSLSSRPWTWTTAG